MVALSDFNSPVAKRVELGDFVGSPSRKPVLNRATITNTAAHAAMLTTPDKTESTYLKTQDDLTYGASSATLNQVLAENDQYNADADYEALHSIMYDPNIDTDTKATALSKFGEASQRSSSLYKRVAAAALTADSEPDDNDEVEFTRIDAAKVLDQVDEFNGYAQQQINRMNDLQDPNVVSYLHDMVEMFLPFVEGANVAQIANDMYKEDGSINPLAVGKAFTLLGESKVDMRTTIASMPIEQQRAFAETLVGYIQNASGPQALNPNQLMALDQMNTFLLQGSYSGTDRFLDNLSSLADMTMIGGIFTKGIRGATAGARAGKVAANAAGDARRYEKAIEALDEADIATNMNNLLTPTDEIINSMYAVDKMSAEEVAEARKVIDESLGGVEDVSIDNIIDRISGFDKATSEEIAQARESLQGAVGARNTELQAMVNEDTIKATRDILAERVINTINTTGASKVITVGEDGLPADLFNDIRAIIDKRVTPTTVNSRTLGNDIVTDVKAVLADRGLQDINKSTGANLKGFITTNTRESNIRRRYARTQVSPTSLSQTIKDVNPAKARGIHATVVADTSGRAADVYYGSNRVDAIANDVLPEVVEQSGTVRNKVAMDEAAPTPNKSVAGEIRDAKGNIHFAPEEKQAARLKARDEWRDVQGLVPRVEMSSIGDTARGVNFSVVYGPKDGGFSDALQAIEQAKFGLRKYGVKDEDVEVLVRDATGDYIPTKDFSQKGSYLVRVNYDYEISPADIVGWATTSAGNWRFADVRIGGTTGQAGGLTQHFVPPTAIVDPLLLNAASVAADRAPWINSLLLDVAKDYSSKYHALPAYQKDLVTQYIIEANAKELKFNSVNLAARGMDDKAIDTVRSWKTVNDTIYEFENADMNKTLRTRGYQRFVDQSGKTDLVVKPVPRPGNGVKAFSTEDGGRIVVISKEQIDELYENGGTLAKTRSPVELEDDVFELVISPQNTTAGYLRRIRDEDPTLNYRHGHYTVRYTDPYFITKEIRGKNGEVFTKAIASAGDRVSAQREVDRLRATDEKGVYTFRGDIKTDPEAFADMEWSSLVSSGRTAQRVRGARLNSVGSAHPDLNHLHIDSPEESLIKSIRSLSQRVSHRDFIESAKTRWAKQFGHLVQKQEGQVKWPEEVNAIGKMNAEASLSEVKDAVATWRYIEAIDSGYANLIDDASKVMFKSFSDLAGRKGWSHVEKASRKADQFNPSQFLRKKAFRLMLAFNPLRQAVIQAAQAIPVIAATNPLGAPRVAAQMMLINYMNRGGDVASWSKTVANQLTGLTPDEARAMIRDYKRSGIESAVNANTFIRDDMGKIVDRGTLAKIDSTLSKPGNFFQKIGFEAGENALMRSVWLSEYDNLRRKVKNIGPEELDNLNARVRHLTLNMNRAGELPYNENALSVALQFMQAPHKAFAQVMMGHRGLTAGDRIKLGTAYIATFGLGANWIADQVGKIIPEDNPVKDLVEGGLFNAALNKTLSTIFQEDVNTDFSDSMRLLEFPNLLKFWEGVMANGLGETMANSPSVGLVFGDSPRLSRLIQSFARPFVVDDSKRPEEFASIGLEFLNLFSGASNYFKAKYILEHQRTMSTSGAIIDWESNHVEAMMKLAGFATIDEVKYYGTNERLYQKSGEVVRSDVEKVVDEMNRRLALKGIDNHQQEYWLTQLSEAQRVWGNNPFYLKEFYSTVVARMNRGEEGLFRTLLSQAGVVDEGKMEEILRNAPSNLTDEQKDAIRSTMRIIKESE